MNLNGNLEYIFIIILLLVFVIWFLNFFRKYVCKKKQCISGYYKYCSKCKSDTCHDYYQTPSKDFAWEDHSNKGIEHYTCKCCDHKVSI